MFSVRINYIFKDWFHFPIRYLSLPTSLWIVKCRDIVSDIVLPKMDFYWSVTKMSTSVTDNSLQRSKSYKDVILYKIYYNLKIVSSSSFWFHLSWNIINSKRKWSHEINVPNIKNLNYKNERLWHLIFRSQIIYSLTMIIWSTKEIYILKQWWLIKTACKYLKGCSFCWNCPP